MTTNARSIPILTYHSISSRAGPTSIPADVFKAQMDVLAKTDGDVLSLSEFLEWHEGKRDAPQGSVVITFDDAFTDFAETAHPILKEHGFPACVFVPAAHMGKAEAWHGADEPARPLMNAKRMKALSGNGITFGAHSLTHPDLTKLDDDQLRREVHDSGQVLAEEFGSPTRFFAPPYGYSDERVRTAIKDSYELSVGVRLGVADRQSPLFDLPRIEMHYFRDAQKFETFVRGSGSLYFQMRRFARVARLAVLSILRPGK